MPAQTRKNWDDGVRCTVLTLWVTGTPPKQIKELYGMSRQTLYDIKKKALDRGWVEGSPVLLEHVSRAPQSG